jgi:hypothetical protein
MMKRTTLTTAAFLGGLALLVTAERLVGRVSDAEQASAMVEAL